MIGDYLIMDILDWLSEWFNYHCDNNWEHEYGYRICNMDNPGVLVEIDLIETNQEDLELEEISIVKDEDDDWFRYKIENQKFIGMGDPSKLKVLLTTFKKIVEENGGYKFLKSYRRIINKYSRYDGFLSEHSISVPYKKLVNCVEEFLENNIEIESIEVVEFKGPEGEVIGTFKSVSQFKEFEGDYHYFINVKK
jgi:hypothetical protein